MKKILSLGLALTFLFPGIAAAHSVNQPPFVYINDAATTFYSIGYASSPALNLPQDASPNNYVVNDEIAFRIDTSALPVFPEDLPNITFHWDFGDGTKKDGLEVQHQYIKAAPTLLSLTTTDKRNNEPPQLLDTVLLNILPSKDYQLPQAIIEVNSQRSTDWRTDILNADFNKKVSFDGSRSIPGSSPITSYIWDLGDQQVSRDMKPTHMFNPVISTAQPVLRVIDSSGFYSDTTVQLSNSTLAPLTAASTTAVSSAQTGKTPLYLSILGIVILAGGVTYFLSRRRHILPKKGRRY
jgi:LPXTG-motif cell wall-anchored protein